jgi:hypothetical protein
MQRGNRWIVSVLVIVSLLVPACGGSSADEAGAPAKIELVEGTNLSRVILTPEAAERLDIRTALVRGENSGRTVIPYGAVLYSPNGETWTYINPEPLTFVRERIVVARIDGDRAVLSKGPAHGTKVATVGVPELFGAESGVGGEH